MDTDSIIIEIDSTKKENTLSLSDLLTKLVEKYR